MVKHGEVMIEMIDDTSFWTHTFGYKPGFEEDMVCSQIHAYGVHWILSDLILGDKTIYVKTSNKHWKPGGVTAWKDLVEYSISGYEKVKGRPDVYKALIFKWDMGKYLKITEQLK